jgi:hypothetical protein
MNFKPTLWKNIVSILVIAIADFILGISRAGCGVNLTTGKAVCPNFYLLPIVILPSLVSGIIVYILWSLFQKK